jgi:gamma-glutamyltranspeptidase/glutathione hydrolase
MFGPLSITVPGAVRSWSDAHRRYGRLPPEQLLAPAIQLARDGFPAWHGLIRAIEFTAPQATELFGPHAGFGQVFRALGRQWRSGERILLPALAATLERLASAGFDDFYDGDVGDLQARGLAAVGSPLTAADFREHTSTWTEPIATDYRGVRVTAHPPNSQGLVALEILNVLEQFEPPARTSFGPAGAADAHWIHLGIEASKLAMADRDAHLSDPEAVDVPTERLLSEGHARELAARIDPERAAMPRPATVPLGGGTAYMATVDAEGNAVSLIESNYMGFGSAVVDPRTGIHYQNRGAYFSLEAEHPNVLAPRKRTLHTLMPGMLFRDGAPWIVIGSMGGDAQPQIHAQVVSALVDGGTDIATAIGMPRWFVEPETHFAPPIAVQAEPRFAAGILDRLAELGHPVTRADAFDGTLGHCHAIELVDGGPSGGGQSSGGTLAAVTDPRSAGLPAVF